MNTYIDFLFLPEELGNLFIGQHMDLHWRDNCICPTEEEYKGMVVGSKFFFYFYCFFVLFFKKYDKGLYISFYFLFIYYSVLFWWTIKPGQGFWQKLFVEFICFFLFFFVKYHIKHEKNIRILHHDSWKILCKFSKSFFPKFLPLSCGHMQLALKPKLNYSPSYSPRCWITWEMARTENWKKATESVQRNKRNML